MREWFSHEFENLSTLLQAFVTVFTSFHKRRMKGFWASSFVVVLFSIVPSSHPQFQGGVEKPEIFQAELFLNRDELTSGLYEGEVIGRKLFGDSQIPHGTGTIYYFTTDKFHRLNYTGDWRNGTRNGNGTTHFKDGAIYTGEYKTGLEHGSGFIHYPNGNTLDAEFIAGKIQGHGVFRYNNGDQREGFFRDNILDGQVIFTRINGETVIEKWVNGKKVDDDGSEQESSNAAIVEIPEVTSQSRNTKKTTKKPQPNKGLDGSRNRFTNGIDLEALREAIRSGDKSAQFTTSGREPKSRDGVSQEDVSRLGEEARLRHRQFLFEIYKNVNK